MRDKPSPFYCVKRYTNVSKIYLGYDSDLPNAPAIEEWRGILHNASVHFAEILRNDGLDLEITDRAVTDVFAADPDALHLTVVYSFIENTSFSIPPPDDHIAVWIVERKRNLSGAAPYIEEHTDVQFFKAEQAARRDFGLLSAAPHNQLNNIVCQVLRFSANKQCVQNKRGTTEIIPLSVSCIEPSDEVDPLIEQYKINIERQHNNDK